MKQNKTNYSQQFAKKSSLFALVALVVLVASLLLSSMPLVGSRAYEQEQRGGQFGSRANISINIVQDLPEYSQFSVGDDAKLTVKVHVNSSITQGYMLTYQWYSSDANGNDRKIITSAQKDTLLVPTDLEGIFYYFVKVNLKSIGQSGMPGLDGGVTPATSHVAEVVIATGPAQKPNITSQPKSNSVNVGTSVSLDVKAEANGELSYQWYSSENGDMDSASTIDGETSSSMQVDTSQQGEFYYFVEVTNTVIEDGVTYTANKNSDIANIVVGDFKEIPVIISDPESAVVEQYDSTYTISVEVAEIESGELSYQWYRSDRMSNQGGTAIKEATFATTTVDTTELGQSFYYVVVTNTIDEDSWTAISSVAVIDVVQSLHTPLIVSQPQSVTLEQGTFEEILLNVEVEIPYDYDNPASSVVTYQWYNNTIPSNQGGNSLGEDYQEATINVTRETVGPTYYYVVITNKVDGGTIDGSPDGYQTVSDVAIVTILEGGQVTEPTDPETPDGGDNYGRDGVNDGHLIGKKSKGAGTVLWYVLGGIVAMISLGAFIALPMSRAKKNRARNGRYR